jgi:hypothetical protein
MNLGCRETGNGKWGRGNANAGFIGPLVRKGREGDRMGYANAVLQYDADADADAVLPFDAAGREGLLLGCVAEIK